jgi:hypothetical protein
VKRVGETSQGETIVIWDFLQRYDESWIWRCADRQEITESSRNFAALEECIADAVMHGYSDRKTGRAAKALEKPRAARKTKTKEKAKVRPSSRRT